MKTNLVKGFSYNGLMIKSWDLAEEEIREVELLGVPTPVDPGFVAIRDQGNVRHVPTFALSEVPSIDFGSLLTPEQEAEREQCGMLFGAGDVTTEPGLIPIQDLL